MLFLFLVKMPIDFCNLLVRVIFLGHSWHLWLVLVLYLTNLIFHVSRFILLNFILELTFFLVSLLCLLHFRLIVNNTKFLTASIRKHHYYHVPGLVSTSCWTSVLDGLKDMQGLHQIQLTNLQLYFAQFRL